MLQSFSPFFSPDETRHWAWASRLATQTENTPGNCSAYEQLISSYPFESMNRRLNLKFLGWDATLKNTEPTCPSIEDGSHYVFSFTYPQALLAIRFSDLIFKSKVSLFNAAKTYEASRYLGLIFVFLILGFILKRTLRDPQVNRSVFFIALLSILSFPVVLQQIASISNDYMVIIASISLALLHLYRHEISMPEILIHFLFIIGGAITKPVILPLIFLIGFLNFIDSKKLNLINFSLLFATLIVLGRGLYFYRYGTSGLSIDERAVQQKAYLLSHPFSSIWTILSSSLDKFYRLPGTRISWLSIRIPTLSYILTHSWILVVIYLFAQLKGIPVASLSARIKRFSHTGCAFAFLFLVGLALYIGESGVGAAKVFGLQARYYIPLWIVSAAIFSANLNVKTFKTRKMGVTFQRKLIFSSLFIGVTLLLNGVLISIQLDNIFK